jgi:hypothetical protein
MAPEALSTKIGAICTIARGTARARRSASNFDFGPGMPVRREIKDIATPNSSFILYLLLHLTSDAEPAPEILLQIVFTRYIQF